MAAKINYFDILQVHPRASDEVIKAAYKALMKQHYPNGIKGDDRLARSLNEAFSVLSDPKKREAFEQSFDNLEGIQIGNYQVLGKLFEGGFGTTYRGVQVLTGMPVCIKHCSRVSPVFEQIMIEETKAVWDLRHFAIPAMRDLVKLDDGSLALIMSYIEGPNLEEVIQKVGKLDAEHVAWITERVLNALKYLHYHGVVHGDVKPGNIIIQPESHAAVLVDYGLSSIKPTVGSTSKGYTPDFASPEEMNGTPLLPESDLFSLGITMLYCLNGGNMDLVRDRKVSNKVPDEIALFIRDLIKIDPLARPNWEKEDLCDKIQEVRTRAFGRHRSGMIPIPGI